MLKNMKISNFIFLCLILLKKLIQKIELTSYKKIKFHLKT